MLDCIQKNKTAICVTQLDESLELESRQQLIPQNWEKITAILTILLLSPVLFCIKVGKGDGVAISEVIPLLKRLNLEINFASGTAETCTAAVRRRRREILTQTAAAKF